MSADSGSISHAALVCVNCKARKKKCDKVLPHCSYCIRYSKGLKCRYGQVLRPRMRPLSPLSPSPETVTSALTPQSFGLHAIPKEPGTREVNLYLQVNAMIRATGQYIDDVTASYFISTHRYLPIISRSRFHNNLITCGTTPAADFSVLLLSLCLITFDPRRLRRTKHVSPTIDHESLHLAAKSLFAQVQISYRPSIHLIQAGLLIALYEYAQGQPDNAFTTIGGCARMAYTAGIHLHQRRPRKPSEMSQMEPELGNWLELAEEANTWWGIVIWERLFVCDATRQDQPLSTVIPNDDSSLPLECDILDQCDVMDAGSIPDTPVSCLDAQDTIGYGKAAQMACLLDKFFEHMKISNLETRLNHLEALDIELRHLLRLSMDKCFGQGVYCVGICMGMRVLYTLHQHMSEHDPLRRRSSQAALETLVKIIADIAESHTLTEIPWIDMLAPGYMYVAQETLRFIYTCSTQWRDEAWVQDVEEQLRAETEEVTRRRGGGDSMGSGKCL